MKTALVTSAMVFAVAGPFAALVPLAVAGAIHAARSPDRLLDVAFAGTFCAIGYLAG